MRLTHLIIAVAALIALAGCAQTACTKDAKVCPDGSTVGRVYPGCEFAPCPSGLPNPASAFCVEKGGTVKIVTEEAGQRGICTLADGTECDEWEYYRGECPIVEDEKQCETSEDCACGRNELTGECFLGNIRFVVTDDPCPDFCTGIAGNLYLACENNECVQKTRSADCPQLTPPGPNFCPDGRIIAGDIDERGCQGPPKCEPVACTADAKICPDGSAVGRVAPDCEFAPCPGGGKLQAYDCTPEQRNAEMCTADYAPVCAYVQIQCITTPCDPVHETYSNACAACRNPLVLSYTTGECEG